MATRLAETTAAPSKWRVRKKSSVAAVVGDGVLDVCSGCPRQRMTLQCDLSVKQSDGESWCSVWDIIRIFSLPAIVV